MGLFKYIIRSIVYYFKQHIALFFGVVVSATVLAGGLIIGDSISYSLKKMIDIRLGKTEYAVKSGTRFMDTKLAYKLSDELQVPTAPLLMLKGIATQSITGQRVNNVGIIGVDSTFSSICYATFPTPENDLAVVGNTLAKRMGLKVGDMLLLRVESANRIPVNAPFAKEPNPTVAIRVTISGIANDDELARLNLQNDQTVPYNVFVSSTFLSNKMDLSGLSNTILVAGSSGGLKKDQIQKAIQGQWSLKDMGLKIKHYENNTFDLTSSRVFIDTVIQSKVERAGFTQQQIITYLVNDIAYNDRHTPYSFASAVSRGLAGTELDDDQVLINRWTADDLNARPGDTLQLTYFEIGQLRDLKQASSKFVIKGIIPTISSEINSTLMPDFQGFSGAGHCSDWDAGVPIDFQRIRDKDEGYWNQYKGTPKVILSLTAGKQLWANQFGSLTAIRFNASEVKEAQLKSTILEMAEPLDVGINVLNLRKEGAKAANNAVNFTELFLSMSFFIILAGILLTVLIYALHFQRRSKETALLSSMGFSVRKILIIRIIESLFIIILGSVVGTFIGLIYNKGLIAALNTLWNDIVRTDVILVHIEASTLVLSIIISIAIALIPIYFVTVKQLKKSIAGQLKEDRIESKQSDRKGKWRIVFGIAMLVLALLLVGYSLAIGAYNNAMLYLSAASLVLLGGIGLSSGLLKKPFAGRKHFIPSMKKLALKNMQRNPGRTLAVIILLAIGTFTVGITGANRKTFYGSENSRNSGTGGYLLWAETTSPVVFDLNSEKGQERLLYDSIKQLKNVQFLQFSRLEGDEASCHNLNQVQRPRLLAVDPTKFDAMDAFTFVNHLPFISQENPWLSLDKTLDDSTYVAYVDQTVLTYSLQKKLGDTLIYTNEFGEPFRLLLAGALNNTIFQGNILVSKEILREQFPGLGGTKTILVDAPREKQKSIAKILSESLVDYGIDVTPTSERLANFYSVTNTYLSIFMALSGLGFLIGTIGLGIILLRNLQERRKELALLMATGYSKSMIFRLVFIENLYLLVIGIAIGLMAAFIGILPSLLSPAFNLESVFLIVLIGGIFISGLAWIYFPLRSALKKPLIPSLRNE